MDKLYYSISEVSQLLDESVSAVRFWSNSFEKFIKPRRNAKGNRQFTAADIETLKQVKHLLKVEGLTLEGAAKKLSGDRTAVDKSVKALESLKRIREQLVEIKKIM